MSRLLTGLDANYMSVGTPAALDITGTALSVWCWAFPDVATGTRRIVSRWDFPGNKKHYLIGHNVTPVWEFAIGDGGANADIVTTAIAPTANVWHGLGLRKNGTGAGALTAFVDGVSTSAASNLSMATSTCPLQLGREVNNGAPMSGRLAEVGIWDVALSDAEFAALLKGISPLHIRRGHLKGYWPLFGVAFPEADISGGISNATQNGTVNAANHAPVGRLAA
jgi:hypothetical protein